MGAPVLTAAQMQAQAVATAKAALAPQQQTVASQQAQAAAAALANSQAITGLHGAAAQMLASIAPAVQGVYGQAADETGQLAGGFSQNIQDEIAAANAKNADYAQSQGQSAPTGGTAPDPQHMANVAYALGGYIPGSSLASQGAAATSEAANLPAIDHAQATSDLNANLANEATTNKSLQDQLTQISSQSPQLQQAALAALQGSNLNNQQFNETVANDKASKAANAAQLAETVRANKAGETVSAVNANTQADAEKLYEAEFGYKQTNDAANLQIKSNAQQIQVEKMTQAGLKVNVGASKLYGFIVDNDNNPVYDSKGNYIPVKGTTSSTPTSYQRAVNAARLLRGTPASNPQPGVNGPGMYLAEKGAQGVFPAKISTTDGSTIWPATTNDPSKAALKSSGKTFVEAQTDLVNRFNVTRPQARKALIAEGWMPDGIRPKK